jgi:hypothetical protein
MAPRFTCGTSLAIVGDVLIRRCAWHRTYHRYPMAIGVASWRGRGVSFTDGMCAGCAVHFRRQWNLPDVPAAVAVASFAPGMAFLRVAATIVVILGFMLEARLLDDVRIPLRLAAAPEGVSVAAVTPAASAPEVAPARAVSTRSRPRPRPPSVKAPPARPQPVAVVAASPPVVYAAPLEADAAVSLVGLTEPAPEGVDTPRWPAGAWPSFAYASVPHAGLTQQTP